MNRHGLSYKPITALGNGKRLFHRAGNRLRNQQVMFHYDVVLRGRQSVLIISSSIANLIEVVRSPSF